MFALFGSSSTVLTLTIKTTNGELEDTIQIQSDESVQSLSLYLSADESLSIHNLIIYTGEQFKDSHR